MGKTYRNVNAQSDSVSMFGSPHNRGFAKTKKRHSRHSIRNKNKNVTEETIQTTSKHRKVNEYKDIEQIGNIPNYPYWRLKNTLEEIGGAKRCDRSDYNKWTKEDGNIIETINKAIDKNKNIESNCRACYANCTERYLNATKKQIERRGKACLFRGHR